MEGKDEILYFLIEHPFKEEKTVVYNRDKILGALNQFKEGIKIKRVLHVSQKEQKQKEKVIKAEKSLIESYEKGSGGLRKQAIFSFFLGSALSYLFFKPLFRLGYLPILGFLTRTFKSISPEIVGHYVDLGAQLVALGIGMILGLLPLILAGVVIYHACKSTKKDKKYVRLVRDLEKQELQIVEDENLTSFCNETSDLLTETKKEAQILREAKSEHERTEACQSIICLLEKLAIIARILKLSHIDDYYAGLENSFYELENRLKKPRFRQNNEKLVKKLLGDLK